MASIIGNRVALPEAAVNRPEPGGPIPRAFWALPGALLALAALLVLGAADGPRLSAQLALVELDRHVRYLKPRQLLMVRAGLVAGAALAALMASLVMLRARQLAPRVSPCLSRALAAPAHVWAALAAWAGAERAQAAALGGLLLAGLALRAALMTRPMSFDEATTFVYFASRGLLDIISDYALPNNHILQTLLVHLSYALGGDSPAVLRMPALLAGLATIPLTYALARRLAGPRAALLAAAIVALAPPLVEYSAQARGYTLLTAMLLVMFLAASTLLARRSLPAWSALVGAAALGGLTIPTMAMGYVAVAAWLLLAAEPARRRQLGLELALASAATGVATGLLYLPAMIRSGVGALFANEYVSHQSAGGLLPQVQVRLGELASCWTGALPALAALALGGLGAFALLLAVTRKERALQALVLATLFAAGLFLGLQQVAPPARIYIFFFPLAAIVVASGAERALRRLLPPGRPAAERIWVLVALLAGLGFGAFRAAHGGLAGPGLTIPGAGLAGAGNVCAEGYYGDAPRMAEFLGPLLAQPRSVAVAYEYSGMAEGLQFELMRRHVNPARLLFSRPSRGLRQLSGYATAYVLTETHRGWDTLPLADPAAVLGVDVATLGAEFRILPVGRFAESALFRLERRVPVTGPPRADRIAYPH